MANLQRLLGGMLASGMAGRSRRGPAFAASPFSSRRRSGLSGFKKTAGLGALAYLAYNAYQDYQKNNPSGASGPASGGRTPGGAGQAAGSSGSPSLGERLGNLLRPQASEPEPEPASLPDDQALLLIRAMIAAANADGEITAEERQQIVSRLDQAGAGPEERAVLDQEMASPRSIDDLVKEVHDQETAEEVYLASRIAMDPDTRAERAYLDYLISRLNIPQDRVEELNEAA